MNLLDIVLKDNIIDDNEYELMKNFENKILQDANKQAYADNILTNDEKQILDALSGALNNLSNLESL